jgi:hypothetical protein
MECGASVMRPNWLTNHSACNATLVNGMQAGLLRFPTLSSGIEIVSRDSVNLYAEAATKPPQAIQVADRWHLLHNLSEMLVDLLNPHHRLSAEVAKAASITPRRGPGPFSSAAELAATPAPLSRGTREGKS